MRRGKSRPESRDYRSYFGKLNASSCEPTVQMSMHGSTRRRGRANERWVTRTFPHRPPSLGHVSAARVRRRKQGAAVPQSSPRLPAVSRSDVGARHDEVYAGTFSKQVQCGVWIDMKPAWVKLLAGDIYKPAEESSLTTKKLLSHNFLRLKPRFSTFSLRSKGQRVASGSFNLPPRP